MNLKFDVHDERFRKVVIEHVLSTLRVYTEHWIGPPANASEVQSRWDALINDAVASFLRDPVFIEGVVRKYVEGKIKARVDAILRKAQKALVIEQMRADRMLREAVESLVRQRDEEHTDA